MEACSINYREDLYYISFVEKDSRLMFIAFHENPTGNKAKRRTEDVGQVVDKRRKMERSDSVQSSPHTTIPSDDEDEMDEHIDDVQDPALKKLVKSVTKQQTLIAESNRTMKDFVNIEKERLDVEREMMRRKIKKDELQREKLERKREKRRLKKQNKMGNE